MALLVISLTDNFYLLASVSFVAFFILAITITNQNIFCFELSQRGSYWFFVTQQGLCQFGNHPGDHPGVHQGVHQGDHQGDHLFEEFALTAHSRISFLGCWLIFTTQEHSNKSKSTFIFKDSLSTKDYSRLKRIIVALK